MHRKLPIGIQSFEKLREEGFLYVDKTAYVHELVRAGAPVFLSRPRRFGKSLLVSTLRAYFEGRRDLFGGLAIEKLEEGNPKAWQPRPVFHFDFTGRDYNLTSLEDVLGDMLGTWEATYGTSGSTDLGGRFYRLLAAAHAQSGHRVAVLVDEYDKPLLDAMDDPVLQDHNRAVCKGFFGTLKRADEHLKFALLTGVTKFSKVSIFSDLNQLRDISLSPAYASVCGVTAGELEDTFGPEVDALAAGLGTNRAGCIKALREMYDGYCFHPGGPAEGRMVYNPFSLVNAFADLRIGPYWFSTGTPTFIYGRMRESGLDPRRLTDGSIYATEGRLSDYRADDPDPVPLLYQAGYLTIRAANERTGRFKLGVPNGEVEDGLVEGLLAVWAPGYSEARGTDVFALLDCVESGDTEGMRRIIAALFASIPYTREGDPFENYFQTVLWLTFTLLGRYARTEVHQAGGRVDCVVETGAHVYVMEFKRGGTGTEALEQISERGYAKPYAADSRHLHLIGCSFDPTTRLLSDWETRPR